MLLCVSKNSWTCTPKKDEFYCMQNFPEALSNGYFNKLHCEQKRVKETNSGMNRVFQV